MSSKQRKHPGTPFIVAGVVLIAAALALLLYNNWESDRGGDASETGVVALESIIFNNQMNGTEFEDPVDEEPEALPDEAQ